MNPGICKHHHNIPDANKLKSIAGGEAKGEAMAKLGVVMEFLTESIT
jgi:hypothetical protein